MTFIELKTSFISAFTPTVFWLLKFLFVGYIIQLVACKILGMLDEEIKDDVIECALRLNDLDNDIQDFLKQRSTKKISIDLFPKEVKYYG